MTRLGSYNLVRMIGEGGFGRTYEGRHYLNPKLRACLKQGINISSADEKILITEANVLAEIHHHSLPAFRDLYKADDGSLVLAMSYIDAKDLEHSVKKHKAIHPEDVCWIAQRSLNALYYLHSHGIIHGDVKPPNIMIKAKERNVFLVDFGLSSIRPTASTKPVGYTEIFAAPEVYKGLPPIPQSDLYSLGVTMIYALGGNPVSKTMPKYVPQPIQKFCQDLTRSDAMQRPSWGSEDLVSRLSDVRMESFGRRHVGLPKTKM